MEHLLKIFESIKNDFCDLTTYKLRGETIEVIVPQSTLNDKFVSVFIKEFKGNYIVSDGGWVDSNSYEVEIDDHSEEIIKRITSYYQQNYEIRETFDQSGTVFYYKLCENIKILSSIVFDLSNFITGTVNALGIRYRDEKEDKEKETFRKDANDFLKANYNDKVRLRGSLNDLKNIKFNAIITQSSEISLISYVTGSTSYYFTNDLRKSIVNFEISEKSRYKDFIKEKISILNDGADGFKNDGLGSLINLLSEKTTREPVLWSEKEKVLDYIE